MTPEVIILMQLISNIMICIGVWTMNLIICTIIYMEVKKWVNG